ncbi:hypothetical protein DUD97_25075 [Salmonella enterica subsp. enterica serovar Pomona]|nr:hypothetical protein [Salmonella enterica subsp. enterica serovar Pomona]
MKADFTGLTGDDIRTLAGSLVPFRVHDVYADQDTSSPFTDGRIAFYGELKQHKPATNLGETVDVFHTGDARKYCTSVVRDISWPTNNDSTNGYVGEAVMSGEPTGGQTTSDSTMSTIYMGNIASSIRTGGDTNPSCSWTAFAWEGGMAATSASLTRPCTAMATGTTRSSARFSPACWFS